MTEEFRSSPPLSQDYPGRTAVRQEAKDTVQRIMGNGIVPPQDPPSTPLQGGSGVEGSSTTDVAKGQAGEVAATAKQAGTHVAGAVKEQAGQVTAEAGKQAKQLLTQAQSEISEQAGATQQRVADGLHALADELGGMADKSDQDGPATDLARQAADRARQAAGWLAERDPGALLDEVRSFARRKPGTYLAVALGAGVLAGRLTRGLTAPTGENPDGTATSLSSGVATPTAAPTAAPMAAPSSGNLGARPGQLNGNDPTRDTLGYDSGTAPGELPPAPAPMGGLATTGAQGDPRTEMTP